MLLRLRLVLVLVLVLLVLLVVLARRGSRRVVGFARSLLGVAFGRWTRSGCLAPTFDVNIM